MPEFFTTAEAAVLAEAAPRSIEKAIEEGIVEVRRGIPPRMTSARPRRLLSEEAVYFVAFMKGCGVEFSKDHKRSIWKHFKTTPPNRLLSASWHISPGVDVRPGDLVRAVKERVNWYARARNRWIESNPEVMGGTPVIKGTRMSVYSVAGRVDHGEKIEDILRDNPDVDRDAIEAAVAYARANPLVGRPGGKPWR